MSSTNKTTYLQLPIFIGTDTPSWLGDWNTAMNAIDAGVNNANNAASNAKNAADSAESKADGNTESISAINAELATIKEAVQNYDQILLFNQVNTAVADNNFSIKTCYMVQNTNKTLSKMYGYFRFNNPLSNPIRYNYTDTAGTSPWYDLFTVEDNCFNLQQSAQPNYNQSLTICSGLWVTPISTTPPSTRVYGRWVRAWYDGASTHVGVCFSASDSNNPDGTYIIIQNAVVFLSGSVYNPSTTPDE